MNPEPTLQVLSLGAGVQSSTMALMAAHGELPRPNFGIFADTGDEPTAVYEWLGNLEGIISNPLKVKYPYKIYRVMEKQGLSKSLLKLKTSKAGNKYSDGCLPAFVKDKSGKSGGMLSRQCTYQFKIAPIRRKTRELLDRYPRAGDVEMWIGISTDEAMRMKPSNVQYIAHRWPLIEKNMSRHDCLQWMENHNYPKPSRSACVFCPFHNDDDWKTMKEHDPVSFAQAVQFERDYNKALIQAPKMRGAEVFLHNSRVPLDKVDFTDSGPNQLNLFGNECEGVCGV